MDPVTGLALGRVGIGSVSLASPGLATRMFRLDASTNPQLPYMTRLFGSREIALGVMTLMARGEARRRLVQFGIAIDGVDAFAAVAAAASGSVSKLTGALLTAPAVGAVVAGVIGLQD